MEIVKVSDHSQYMFYLVTRQLIKLVGTLFAHRTKSKVPEEVKPKATSVIGESKRLALGYIAWHHAPFARTVSLLPSTGPRMVNIGERGFRLTNYTLSLCLVADRGEAACFKYEHMAAKPAQR